MIHVESARSQAGYLRRRPRRMSSRRRPIVISPAAKTSHGTRISRLAAVTFSSLARLILGSLTFTLASRGAQRVKPL